jgi:non-canonical (house-cleaning) NTP pyrophosphatase
VICIVDDAGRVGYGTSPFFELPFDITEQLLAGTELGEVMDHLIGEENTKEKQGAVGYFTKGVMDRRRYYVAGLTVALIPFLNAELYFGV